MALPVAGYPSKRAAIYALSDQGKSPDEILAVVGGTKKQLMIALAPSQRSRHPGEQKKPALPPPASRVPTMQPARDPNAQRDKARRLFGKTMLYIAEALDVTPEWLFSIGLKGIVRPPYKGLRLGELMERLALGAELDEDRVDFGPGGFVHPSREDDEAELAEIEEDDDEPAEPVPGPARGRGDRRIVAFGRGAAPPEEREAVRAPGDGEQAGQEEAAPPPAPKAKPVPPPLAEGHTYRLVKFDTGEFLHESLDGLTKDRRYAWKGTTKQLGMVLDRNPQWKDLTPERLA